MSYSKYFSLDEEYYMILCNSTGPSLPVQHILCQHFISITHYTLNKTRHCFVPDIPTHTTPCETQSLLPLYNHSLHQLLFLWKICRAEHFGTRVLNEKFCNSFLYQHVHAIPTSTDKLFYFHVYLLASFSRNANPTNGSLRLRQRICNNWLTSKQRTKIL
jgi:hypothetical protein